MLARKGVIPAAQWARTSRSGGRKVRGATGRDGVSDRGSPRAISCAGSGTGTTACCPHAHRVPPAYTTAAPVLPVFAEEFDRFNILCEVIREYTINVLRMCDKFIDDSLVLILTNNHDDFMECLQKRRERKFIKNSVSKNHIRLQGIGYIITLNY